MKNLSFFKNFIHPPTLMSAIIRYGSALILFYSAIFLGMLISMSDIPGYVLAKTYSYTFEHIIMTAVIILIAAVITDIAEKKMD